MNFIYFAILSEYKINKKSTFYFLPFDYFLILSKDDFIASTLPTKLVAMIGLL